jgi:hypothetical protein
MKTALIIVCVITTVSATARAQPSAEELYTEGQTAYDHGDYATAVVKWQAAYDLSKASGLLFNLAQAKRLSGNCVGAVATYRRFITDDPDSTSEQHKLAKDLALELEGKCPTQTAVLPPPKVVNDPTSGNGAQGRSAPTVVTTQSGRPWKLAGLVTDGAGVVVFAVGLGLGSHGASIGDEVTTACRASCDWAALKDKDARGKRAVTIGKVLDGVGVAAIAGGAVFYFLGVHKETLTITPAPGGGGGVVSWRASW